MLPLSIIVLSLLSLSSIIVVLVILCWHSKRIFYLFRFICGYYLFYEQVGERREGRGITGNSVKWDFMNMNDTHHYAILKLASELTVN